MKSDTNFDGMATSFEEEIYGSSKGYVRLHVLWEDLLSEIPQIARGGLSILDAGGGAGHVALRMARLGNKVTLCDPSQEMLDKAEESIRKANLSDSITVVRSTIQDLEKVVDGKFDVITCHAVLEWLADPKTTLGLLIGFLRHEGHLSLMFYNRNAALLKRIFKGDFAEALQYRKEGWSPSGRSNECTALPEATVRAWLDGFGVRVRSKAGIRIFHDHLPSTVRNREWLDELLVIEKELRKQEPFASLGQHVHLVCEYSQ